VVLKSFVLKQVEVILCVAIGKWRFRSPDRYRRLIDITMPTGIFFHYQQGERLRDFPQALDKILEKDHVFLYDALYPLMAPLWQYMSYKKSMVPNALPLLIPMLTMAMEPGSCLKTIPQYSISAFALAHLGRIIKT